ncbi:MAG: YifB family Mg chelatase-like AAA ATPase [Parvularculales bacterium]
MAAQIHTVAFRGVEAIPVEVQVRMSTGLPAFTLVGLPDKAVAESRERVRAAMDAIGLGLPPKRITVNLAPADVPKEGSHFDLPIALGLMVALNVIPADAAAKYVALGELALDGRLAPVVGILPAALSAAEQKRGLICPDACGAEAAWSGLGEREGGGILAALSLIQIVNHFKGTQMLSDPKPGIPQDEAPAPDLADVRGQEMARRALEVAAAGGHNLLMIGPPGAGKSMLASRLPGILPPMTADEILQSSIVSSLAGEMTTGAMRRTRAFRAPHHSASMAAMVGGGTRARPGEISLAHLGVLFLDELPEFSRPVLDCLRQPVETGEVTVARVNAHITYPARFQMVAAMNPCRCGFAGDAERGCSRQPRCLQDYQTRISGPLLDRFDIRIEVPPVQLSEMTTATPGEASAVVAARVKQARARQEARYQDALPGLRLNAMADGERLRRLAPLDEEGKKLMDKVAAEKSLTARGYHRVLRLALTLADMDNAPELGHKHLAEALAWRGGAVGVMQ